MNKQFMISKRVRAGLIGLACVGMMHLGAVTALADAPAFNYPYNALWPMDLGAGVDPMSLDNAKETCLETPEGVPSPGKWGAAKWRIRLVYGHQKQDMAASLSLSLKGNGSFSGMFTAESQTDISAAMENTAFSMKAYIVAEADYDLLNLARPKLTKEAATLLQDSPSEFRERCGAVYVSKVRRGTRILIELSIANATQAERIEWYNKTKGGGSLGVITAEVEASFRAAFNRHIESNEVNFNVVAQGGEGIQSNVTSQMARLIGDPKQNLSSIMQTLTEYLKTLNQDNPAPIMFFTTPYPGLSGTFSNLIDETKLDTLSDLVQEYAWARSLRSGGRAVLKSAAVRTDLTDAEYARALDTFQKVEQYMNAVASAHQSCKVAPLSEIPAKCSGSAIPIRPRMGALELAIWIFQRN